MKKRLSLLLLTLDDSRIVNEVDRGGVGNSGNINIFTGVFSQVNLNAEGEAGGVTIDTGNLNLTNGGVVDASTFGQGNAGSVSITASDTINIDGEGSDFVTGVTSQVNSNGVGDAGGVTIDTGNLNLTNGGAVSASTFGQGNAGSVSITASDTINIDGEGGSDFVTGAFSTVVSGAVGDAGGSPLPLVISISLIEG